MIPSSPIHRNRLRPWPLVVTALLVAGCALDHAPATVSGPLPQEAYVWQRSRGEPVVQAVRSTAEGREDDDLAGLVLLAAEVSTTPAGGWSVHRVAYAADALPGRRAGLAVRVNPLTPFREELDETAHDLADLVVSEVERARAAGLTVTELQLDYDCPTRRLAAYARFVDLVRSRLAAALPNPPPVTWTALPDWLGSEEFPRLLETLGKVSDTLPGKVSDTVPGYVLQVHSLELPEPGRPAPLVDLEAARRAVEEAARYGRRFRVALPTYGYEARFTVDGDLLGLAAEGTPRRSTGAETAHVASDAVALTELVAEWRRERPPELAGVVWFRLPTGRDLRAWSPEAFRAVRSGRVSELVRPVTVRARGAEPELVEIDLVAPAAGGATPAAVRVAWRDARLLAADGVGGYGATTPGEQSAQFEPRGRDGDPLRPHERRTVAWLRFDEPMDPTEVDLELVD